VIVTEYLCGLRSSDHIEYILIYLAENTWNRGYFTRVQVVQVIYWNDNQVGLLDILFRIT